MSSMIALILMLTIAVTLVALPAANAHTPRWTLKTWAFLSVQPNPIGVGQTAFVNFWIDKTPPTAIAQYGDRWQNFTVSVTHPDGTTEKLGPFASDAVGGAFITYVPSKIGNYTFVFNFPGQTVTGENPGPSGTVAPEFVGDYFEPSTSATVTLAVQQEPIPSAPLTPLPTGYWKRPIISSNTAWYKISGNWLGLAAVSFGSTGMYNVSGNFNPYTTAPNTAHIVWTKPYSFGGLIGGEFGDTLYGSNFMSTSQYEPKFQPIIINGVLYYTLYPTSITTPAGWVAVDLRTGQEIWTINTTVPLRTGQIYQYNSPNQYGGIPYLWAIKPTMAPNTGTTYGMYDAMTGNWILDIVNGTGVTFVEGDEGSLLGYYINATSMTLNLWNSSKCIIGPLNVSLPPGAYPPGWMWRPPQGGSIDWTRGIEWKKPIATNISGVPITPGLTIRKIASDVITMASFGPSGDVQPFSWQAGFILEAGYSAKDGRLLWGPINRTLTPWTRVNIGRPAVALNGVYTHYEMNTGITTGYSLKTGEKLWTTLPRNTTVWAYYESQALAAYGTIYSCDFGGTVVAYDLQTGKQLWEWHTGSSGYETPYGIWPILHVDAAADGKVYFLGGHTYSPPLFRGSRLYCLNATTGEKIWDILNFPITNGPSCALADGYLVESNAYDNQLYCFGKGQTATTVTASPKVSVHGDSVLIEGTVTDQSAGAKGTPAIADAYMTPWMEYLYMQQPMPTNAAGVKVTLDTVDPNGNFVHIGTATSDTSGNFGHAFVPEVPGLYTIIATFEGSESYYASYAETFINVEEAPQATPTATPAAPPDPTPTIIATGVGTGIAIIIAVAIVGILLLRKRP